MKTYQELVDAGILPNQNPITWVSPHQFIGEDKSSYFSTPHTYAQKFVEDQLGITELRKNIATSDENALKAI